MQLLDKAVRSRLDPSFRTNTDPATRSLSAFAMQTYPGYQQATHISILCKALDEAISTPGSRLIVTMPPRHSKSVHVSELLPAYFLGNHPDKRIIAASHTASLAYTFSRRVRNRLNDPRWPFPNVSVADDKGAVQAWDIAGERGGYVAVGVGGSPTGHGADLIVIDDPIRSAADADSQTVRDGLWEWYQGTMRTRLEPGGSIIITATRWHEDDLTGRLLNAALDGGERWQHIHMPAIDEQGNALWPERWPVEALGMIRGSVGSRAWEAQFQGHPTPAEGGILKHVWFGLYAAIPPIAQFVFQSWDTAFKTGDKHDYSVCTTFAHGITGTHIQDVYRERLEYPDLERAAARQFARFRPSAVLIEDKASGQSLIQSLRRTTSIPVIAIPATSDKVARVNEIAPTIEARRVLLPIAATWLDETVHELTSFPLGAHDDIVDSISQGIAWLNKRAQGGGTSSYLPDVDERDDEDIQWLR